MKLSFQREKIILCKTHELKGSFPNSIIILLLKEDKKKSLKEWQKKKQMEIVKYRKILEKA